MVILNHILGFPRMGLYRELKKAQENYWSGKISKSDLFLIGKELRKKHWKIQKESGIDLLAVGDFAWYDHVLNTSMLLGNIPERHRNLDNSIDIDTLFRIARGKAPTGQSVSASDMTKWFNTNYHYIVPEFNKNNKFIYAWSQLLEEVDEALSLGYKIKPVVLGPITYLWLGKVKGEDFNRLDLLKDIIPIYKHLFSKLASKGIEWIQVDEPALVLDLPEKWKNAFYEVYKELKSDLKILIATYFDSIMHNIDIICNLPINGLHVDCVHGNDDLFKLHSKLPQDWVLSAGVINGRNVWRANLMYWFEIITPLMHIRKNIWIGSSCSLLHTPMDLDIETKIDNEIKNWLSFAVQKCKELSLLSNALNTKSSSILEEWSSFVKSRYYSDRVNNIDVQKRVKKIDFTKNNRNNPYNVREEIQKSKFNLPVLPTTTIGSFPQTDFIRKLRLDFKNNTLSLEDYTVEIMNHIRSVIRKQEDLDLDVLVHGEAERNDMVEYFGENLEGFIFTSNGWVQSYGSRCVKPPIIFGDISRSKPITVEWTKYAQSLTNKPVKGMLTGPITILSWSFPREDITKETIAQQIALALQDEVKELEEAGIGIIQIDEPALREGLPLRKIDWKDYLKWAVESFRLSFLGVKDETQIHTHMCYCEFNDIMDSIVALDADVITIETSRSDMELLEFFKKFQYPNSIGPGVYDIHSPNIPTVLWMEKLLKRAVKYIPFQHIWVNPDCGLKTRNWEETEKSLKNMIQATKNLRQSIHEL